MEKEKEKKEKRKKKKEKERKNEKRKNEKTKKKKGLINLSPFGSFRWSSKEHVRGFLRRQRISLVHALQLGNVSTPLRLYIHANL